jgi:hypothetical protein
VNKKLFMIIGIAAVAGLAYWYLTRKGKGFTVPAAASMTTAQVSPQVPAKPGCTAEQTAQANAKIADYYDRQQACYNTPGATWMDLLMVGHNKCQTDKRSLGQGNCHFPTGITAK